MCPCKYFFPQIKSSSICPLCISRFIWHNARKVFVVDAALLILVFLIQSCSESPIIKLPLKAQDLKPGWERVQIKSVGFIDIPPSMEIQSGSYKDFADHFKQENELNISDIVIQTKGANNWEKQGLKQYARILISTTYGDSGDFGTLNMPITKADLEQLPEMDKLLKDQMIQSFEGTIIKLNEWRGTALEKINGMTCIVFSYTRILEGKTPVLVTTYNFPNYDRSHLLTVSYRLSETEIWQDEILTAVNSFRIIDYSSASIEEIETISQKEITQDSVANQTEVSRYIKDLQNSDSINYIRRLHEFLTHDFSGFNVPLNQFSKDMQEEINLMNLHRNLAKKHLWFNISYAKFKNNIFESMRFNYFPIPKDVAYFTQDIEINPHDARLYYKRGKAKRSLSDLWGAIEDFNKAIKINPLYELAYYERANAKYNNDDLKGAVADLTKVIEINPNNGKAYYYRGYFQIMSDKNKESACKDLSRAGELGEEDAYRIIANFCR